MKRAFVLAAMVAIHVSISSAFATEAFIPQILSDGNASRGLALGNSVAATRLATPLPLQPLMPATTQATIDPRVNASIVSQNGTNNLATVVQAGGGNLSAIIQRGTGNQAIVTQTQAAH